ncbi:MAG: phosphoribosylformylglycinamidine cyclo-ligase [Candidatus Ratteibacteria bacterium]|nr:phosphoribosylformylglycinamidine cyclo-ligase [Candidatus Ratteibacteria bacterium]
MRKATYKQAGVNIDRGEEFVDKINRIVKKTHGKQVLSSLSGFGSIFFLKGYKNPILVSSADGVGTKMVLADLVKRYDGVGIDAVAMNVDDVLAMGAQPLFFLDYLACGQIDLKVAVEIIKSVAKGCSQAGCSLIGGETAEMPGFYKKGQFELVGFAVGVLEKGKIIDGAHVRPGDKILGLPSSGLHSNGFSLARKVLFKDAGTDQEKIKILKTKDKKLGKSWSDALLEPTRIYTKSVLPLIKSDIEISGIAHITGGGLMRNIKRILPEGCQAQIFRNKWKVPSLFMRLKELGNITKEEMFKVFNMGIGMVLIVPPQEEKRALTYFDRNKEKVFSIGIVKKGGRKVIIN